MWALVAVRLGKQQALYSLLPMKSRWGHTYLKSKTRWWVRRSVGCVRGLWPVQKPTQEDKQMPGPYAAKSHKSHSCACMHTYAWHGVGGHIGDALEGTLDMLRLEVSIDVIATALELLLRSEGLRTRKGRGA